MCFGNGFLTWIIHKRCLVDLPASRLGNYQRSLFFVLATIFYCRLPKWEKYVKSCLNGLKCWTLFTFCGQNVPLLTGVLRWWFWKSLSIRSWKGKLTHRDTHVDKTIVKNVNRLRWRIFLVTQCFYVRIFGVLQEVMTEKSWKPLPPTGSGVFTFWVNTAWECLLLWKIKWTVSFPETSRWRLWWFPGRHVPGNTPVNKWSQAYHIIDLSSWARQVQDLQKNT